MEFQDGKNVPFLIANLVRASVEIVPVPPVRDVWRQHASPTKCFMTWPVNRIVKLAVATMVLTFVLESDLAAVQNLALLKVYAKHAISSESVKTANTIRKALGNVLSAHQRRIAQ